MGNKGGYINPTIVLLVVTAGTLGQESVFASQHAGFPCFRECLAKGIAYLAEVKVAKSFSPTLVRVSRSLAGLEGGLGGNTVPPQAGPLMC